jgi:lipoprotein-releasing system ATP-binding protein
MVARRKPASVAPARETMAVATKGLTRILDLVVPVTLVEDIDLEIMRGEFVSVTGPSGSGKSSLLYLLGLLDAPTAGEVALLGKETAAMDETERARFRLKHIGFVFQFHFLLPEFTVTDNVMIPMRRLAASGEADMRARALALLESFDIADQAEKRPDQLSGGQRQRVAVARALANEPAIILADEPTGSLDSHNSMIVRDIFTKLAEERGKTVIAVTHEEDFASAAHRNIHLVDGRIARDG